MCCLVELLGMRHAASTHLPSCVHHLLSTMHQVLLPELRDAWAEAQPLRLGATANALESSFTSERGGAARHGWSGAAGSASGQGGHQMGAHACHPHMRATVSWPRPHDAYMYVSTTCQTPCAHVHAFHCIAGLHASPLLPMPPLPASRSVCGPPSTVHPPHMSCSRGRGPPPDPHRLHSCHWPAAAS